MKQIWFYILNILASLYDRIFNAVATVAEAFSFQPVFASVGGVGPQVNSVRYTREKRPCSVTGGFA